jgi:hypothetical protein
MKSRLIIAATALCFLFLSSGNSQEQQTDSGLIAHEWGTFTSIAGSHGQAVEWVPQNGQDDLPNFVEHLGTRQLKFGLQGLVRMETPVLYFHAMHQSTVSVHVRFSKGLLTEWYPHAKVTDPGRRLYDATLLQSPSDGELTWNSVSVEPDARPEFPTEGAASHYYAARETSAAPLSLHSPTGRQQEKFLFYRGVSSFQVPISAIPRNDGRVLISNLTQEVIPQAILFERRGAKLGYRIIGVVRNSSIVDPPELNTDLDSLTRDLEKILVEQGLYADEAHAMVQTWKDSWFEEGSRLLYIVPRTFVDSVLPLSIKPTPGNTVRTFVGRMEIVTPTTEKTVETAFASGDHATLTKYGRFLAPILQTMIDRSTDKDRIQRLRNYQGSVYTELFAQQRAAERGAP